MLDSKIIMVPLASTHDLCLVKNKHPAKAIIGIIGTAIREAMDDLSDFSNIDLLVVMEENNDAALTVAADIKQSFMFVQKELDDTVDNILVITYTKLHIGVYMAITRYTYVYSYVQLYIYI